jgi:hypothetical protein
MSKYTVFYYPDRYVYVGLTTVIIEGEDPLDVANKFYKNDDFYFSEIHDIVENDHE